MSETPKTPWKDGIYANDQNIASFVRVTGEKVEMFPWHEMPKEGGWSFGTNIDYMKNLADYWTKKYNWESQELRLNQQPNYITKVDDIDIHFIFKKSSSPKAIPLILIHGWPGSIVEFLEIIEPLCEPEKYGNKDEICFDEFENYS